MESKEKDMFEEFCFSQIEKKKREYINREIDNYLKSITPLCRLFISEKQERKNIDYIAKESELKFYRDFSYNYICKLSKERERIDNIIDDINNEVTNWFKKQKINIEKNRKPFITEVRFTDNINEVEPRLNMIKILKCEDFNISWFETNGGGLNE